MAVKAVYKDCYSGSGSSSKSSLAILYFKRYEHTEFLNLSVNVLYRFVCYVTEKSTVSRPWNGYLFSLLITSEHHAFKMQ